MFTEIKMNTKTNISTQTHQYEWMGKMVGSWFLHNVYFKQHLTTSLHISTRPVTVVKVLHGFIRSLLYIECVLKLTNCHIVEDASGILIVLL